MSDVSSIRLRHTVTRLTVHMVWATRDRCPWLGLDIDPWLSKQVAAKGEEIGCRVIAVGNACDHVHVLVTHPPTLAVATIAHRLKGASSRVLASQLPQGFAESVSDIARAAAYVRHQRQHHDAPAAGPPEQWEASFAHPWGAER